MEVSDYRINAHVRSVLARHWVDLQGLTFGSFRGIVRVRGELRHLQGGDHADLGQVEAMESEIRSVHGVKRVYFELSNWQRTEEGQWARLERKGPAVKPDLGRGVGMVLEAVEKPPAENRQAELAKQSHEH